MRTLLAGLILIVFQIPSYGQQLSPKAVFSRCWGQLTRTAVTNDNFILQKIESGQISAAEGCSELIRRALLNNSGRFISNAPESTLILQNLNEFHKNWFEAQNYLQAIDEDVNETRYIYDPSQSGYHITLAMFGQNGNLPYDNILSQNQYLEGVRRSNLPENLGGVRECNQGGTPFPCPPLGQPLCAPGSTSPAICNNLANQFEGAFTNFHFLQFGELIGITVASPIFLPQGYPGQNNLFSLPFAPTDMDAETRRRIASLPLTNIQINKTLGGGLIGTPEFITLNSGRAMEDIFDGAIKMPRRWSKSIVTELLCRDLPSLREADVPNNMIQANSSIPFRPIRSCMRCHATLDPMAAVIRNIGFVKAGEYRNVSAKGDTLHLSQYPVGNNLPNSTDPITPIEADNDYHLRPTLGTLRLRGFDGTLYQINVNGLDELADAIISTNDFYACAVKKYYHFLTGISVSLQDLTVPNPPVLTKEELFHRKRVLNLALELKQHKSLLKIADEIFKTKTFQSRSFAEEVP